MNSQSREPSKVEILAGMANHAKWLSVALPGVSIKRAKLESILYIGFIDEEAQKKLPPSDFSTMGRRSIGVDVLRFPDECGAAVGELRSKGALEILKATAICGVSYLTWLFTYEKFVPLLQKTEDATKSPDAEKLIRDMHFSMELFLIVLATGLVLFSCIKAIAGAVKWRRFTRAASEIKSRGEVFPVLCDEFL